MLEHPAEASRNRWDTFREKALEAALAAVADAIFANGIPFGAKLSLIGDEEIAHFMATWPEAYGQRGHSRHFPWPALAEHFRARHRRFDGAIWFEDQLCGLCYGMGSKGQENVTLHFLESYEGDHPLVGQIPVLAFLAADMFAIAIGAQRLRRKTAMADMLHRYTRLNFELADSRGSSTYYQRQVELIP